MKAMQVRLKPFADEEECWFQLSEKGIEVLYSNQVKEDVDLVVKTSYSPQELKELFNFIHSCHLVDVPEIDWEKEWKEHTLFPFKEGKIEIDLHPYGKDIVLKLVPGPGFGDLSHPTTRLMMQMMAPFVSEQDVIDIGSGSGILALTASLLGAKSVLGIDIDEASNKHAQKNAKLNHIENIHFILPKKIPLTTPHLFLMNMILTEQQSAWHSLTHGKKPQGEIITSGILKEGKDFYLEFAEAQGWKLKNMMVEDQWCAFHFDLN